ncbi:Hypothetical predicted protein [Mytilus galloprovincialis]|uniref:Uncharacterized protein n=1 Tax=Mytilus galloprovincialis TaxID=29158 RepID=A0A8B6HMF5_MYTGA|nr:Hypothetical predicted protein [Mytilus galloprovincialis]
MAVNYENRYQLSELKNIYTLPSAPYKKAQKTNKMLIPFEKIDLSLCRKAAYCTIFITSRERMHFWLHALGQSIIIGNKNNPSVKVDWHDSTAQGITERTEFEVHSSESIGDYEGDTLMYKVIVYLTTGKIMIQGKFFQQWCLNEFEKTLQIVENLSSSSEMTTPKSLQFENGEDDIESSTNHHTIRKNAPVNEIMEIQSKNSETLSTNLEIVSTNSEILQEEDQIKLKTPPEKVPITPVLQAKNENITINTDSNNSISNDPHSESSQIQQRLTILEESTINMSSEIFNAHSTIKNFETLLGTNLQGLRNDIVKDVLNLMNKVETSPESIETLKQVHARELKMLREKIQESDIDKKKIIEKFEIEKCQLMSKAKELERNSYQTLKKCFKQRRKSYRIR